ncbi:gp53-like domain-containing protein [Enterobacter asburiae]|uniref:gp53-like domain-containing protein n=1 Tax=Enterobacter asburiae TaxID=61645 RepID=UPI003BE160F3
MLRIGQVEATATQDGKYTDGSVAGGIAATRLRAAAFNAMQEELAHIVESAGLALDINDMTQVLKAIQKLTLSRANPFADIKSDGAAAISTALTNLQLGEAAKRGVGTGANQIPDMSAWTSGGNSTNGWRRSPDGYIEQWGFTTSVTSVIYISFPIPFTTGLISLNEHDSSPDGKIRTIWQFSPASNMGVNAYNIGTLIIGSTAFNTPVLASCRWFASGR